VEETVSLDVAIRNASDRRLFPSALVLLRDFNPEAVTVLNADAVDSTLVGTDPVIGLAYIFDYSDLLGDDRVLTPGETSGPKRWIFHDPGLVAFSFSADALFGLGDAPAHIAGSAFWDANENGEFDRDEEPARTGVVQIENPRGAIALARIDATGHYEVPVRVAGLFRATFWIPLRNAPLCFTTPHPLEILLPPGPRGWPVSFDEADFGLRLRPCPGPEPRVVITHLRPDQIEQDPYELLEAELDGDLLILRVAFSGCSPDHPFMLYISGDFMESEPVRTWALLAHDDLGEFCRAYWTRTLRFNLNPLREEYVASYGAPGLVVLQFRDFNGEIREFVFGP
jgi:hypothetical protein